MINAFYPKNEMSIPPSIIKSWILIAISLSYPALAREIKLILESH